MTPRNPMNGVSSLTGPVPQSRAFPANPPLDRTAGMNGRTWIEAFEYARGRSAARRYAGRAG